MSLRCYTKIKITQRPNDAFPGRQLRSFEIDFVNEGTIKQSWETLTNTCSLRLPGNVNVEDDQGNVVNWSKTAIYADSGNTAPLFIRGDKIEVIVGYWMFDFDSREEVLLVPDQPNFTGYISRIKNRVPIEIECEDEMWRLKQIRVPNKIYKGSAYTVKTMIAEMLSAYPEYTVTDGGFQTNIGDFRTQNETVAQVLERLKNDGGLYSNFTGTSLRVGNVVYDPNVYLNKETVFEFQDNIIADQLEYQRKEDINLAIRAYSQSIEKVNNRNYDGSEKNKRSRIEVLVGRTSNGYGEIANDNTFQGDIVRRPFLNVTSKDELIRQAKATLPKYYYTGFRGSFTTFGYPAVNVGEAAVIRDKRIPERAGTYLIKQVNTTFGMKGIRQAISLHLRIDQGFTVDELNAGAAG